jgi:hypothetical protein
MIAIFQDEVGFAQVQIIDDTKDTNLDLKIINNFDFVNRRNKPFSLSSKIIHTL